MDRPKQFRTASTVIRTTVLHSNMAPKYKLTYFNVTVLAEPIRFLFHYGNIDFEDYRFKNEDWPKIKAQTPFGQVPILEKDGRVANQSVAIGRYVAKQVKLTGANDWEDLEIDAMVDTLVEFRGKLAAYYFEEDPKAKETLKETLFKETIPFFLDRLETIAKNNKGHLAVGKLTWADVYFAAFYDHYNHLVGQNLWKDRPNLQAVAENVLKLPQIKSYVEKRPKTEM